jgi:hypothetical protein
MEDVGYEDLVNCIKVWNARFGDTCRETFDCSSLSRGASLIDDTKWTLFSTGPFANVARYLKTPHGVLVQGKDQKISIMTESVAITLGAV